MITEHDLQEAIAECQGKRDPDASTCIKLAAFYTIKHELYPEKTQLPVDTSPPQLSYSYAAPPNHKVDYDSDTEFGRLIYGRDPAEVWPLVDELISDALRVVNPRLYDSFIRRLQ